MKRLAGLSADVRQYLVITANYWAFTLTDGALRMLVLLYFHQLGYNALQIAMLFLFYEFFGVVTNLVGGWLGARWGLNKTMNVGLFIQVISLLMLLVPLSWLTSPWVMAAQALSGIAKDLNKMSAKSSIKLLVPATGSHQDSQQLFRWVAALTGSKNTLKGVGFFLGGALLSLLDFQGAIGLMVVALMMVWRWSLYALKQDLGKSSFKPKFRDIFSSSQQVNRLALARMFLFCSRDVWFVVALPVFLTEQLGWSHWQIGAFLALWVIGYGVVQAFSPRLTGRNKARITGARDVVLWGLLLAVVPAILGAVLALKPSAALTEMLLIGGLMVFGVLFAINSSVHSFLVVYYARADGASMDVGLYYMANALGRLIGTVLSGYVFLQYSFVACLCLSSLMVCLAAVLGVGLDRLSAATKV